MAPAKRSAKAKPASSARKDGSPPSPFKRPPEVLEPFISTLSEKHIYITHIDTKPADFKRNIFLIPVGMNVCVALLFLLRLYWISPWYAKLVASAFGHPNETTWTATDAPWSVMGWEVGKRALTMLFDFVLFVFVWPWPVEFALGRAHGNPCQWRWKVGFRPKEVYVRRSREWDTVLKDIFADKNSRTILLSYIGQATSPIVQEQKTGYLLMNAQWDLDWAEMVHAHSLIDKKDVAIEAFKNLVLVHHKDYGWMVHDVGASNASAEDERRRQVFAFRDTLAAMGKEDLFYRWVEVVQFESTQPGGFGPEKQEAAAKKIRELFEKENVNFDELWKESLGTMEK